MKNLTNEECLQWVIESGIRVDHGLPALGPDDVNSQTISFSGGQEKIASELIKREILAKSEACVLVWITDWPFASDNELSEFEGKFIRKKGRLIELPGILSAPSELASSGVIDIILKNQWDSFFLTQRHLLAYTNHEGFAYLYCG